jgi:type I restriction enzyme, S subunit
MSDEDSEVLPEGWEVVPLLNLCEIIRGVSYKKGEAKSENANGLIPLLRANNIDDGLKFLDLQYVPASRVKSHQELRYGDVVVAMSSGSKLVVGKAAQVHDGWKGTFGAFCGVLRPTHQIEPKLFGFFFATKAYRNAISQASEGTNINNLKREYFAALSFRLPPLSEQRRIVKAVEHLLEPVSSARERLRRVLNTLKHFKRAVLAAACSGKLTEDWRERHNINETMWLEEEGISYPDCWDCKRTAELVEPGTVITYGIVLPGPNLSDGVPYIRGMDIDDAGRIQTSQLWRTSTAIAAKHKRAEVREGDVLLCVIRNLRVALVPAGLDGANLTQGTVRLRPSSEIIGRYLAYYLASPQAQRWMKERYVGTDMPRINVEHTRIIPVPLPSLEEQREIVRDVSALLALADSIEERAISAYRRVESLTQAVLAKAFRGELVPTEAELARREGRSYEPASELLARLKASTNGEVKTKRTRTKKSSKQSAGTGDGLLEFMEG